MHIRESHLSFSVGSEQTCSHSSSELICSKLLEKAANTDSLYMDNLNLSSLITWSSFFLSHKSISPHKLEAFRDQSFFHHLMMRIFSENIRQLFPSANIIKCKYTSYVTWNFTRQYYLKESWYVSSSCNQLRNRNLACL